MTLGTQSETRVSELKAWMVDVALPFWSTTGWDARRGGFYEKLTPEGVPIENANRRLRVQARQIYVYAHAADLGWCKDGKAIALRGFDYLMEKGHAPDGAPGFVHLLAADGTVENALRDSYDHMFVLLALTWLCKITGDAQIRKVLEDTLAFVDAELTDRDGILLEGKPATLPRRQNPNMHAFEAMLAMHATIQHPEALPRARRLFQFFRSTVFDAETATVREFFTPDWKPIAEPRGSSIEPGHLVEWTWLLRQYEAMAGVHTGEIGSALLDKALMTRDPASGRLFDECDPAGAIRQATSRTWPHTELIKAWIGEAEAGRAEAAEHAHHAIGLLLDSYVRPASPGCYLDQLDRGGAVISDHVTASTLYHLFVAAAEADRVLVKAPG